MRRCLAIGFLLAFVWYAGSSTAVAQQKISRAHMEACVRWILVRDRYVTRNSCDTPVSILFMTLYDGHVVARDVPPGGHFQSDPVATDKAGEMMFTVCPVGYWPSLRFAVENAEPISVSLYNCLPPGKPIS
jgi:hypothetical protein